MIAYYDRTIGVQYPFSKYDQVAAERDFFGGMENESITIIADKALHPAIEDVERSCDLVVSHELAQHWFGDDATMMDWSNEWLNEGFATYFDELWTGEREGPDAFDYARYQGQQEYFAESRSQMRPVVDYRYDDPLQLFDTVGHEGAAERIHMLRYLVGDRRFFATLKHYLLQYQYRNATTDQFFSSIEASLGIDLRWFKDEWFYRAAYPRYDVSFNYDITRHRLVLAVAQSTADGKPFRMPVDIEAYAGGTVVRTHMMIDSMHQRIELNGLASYPKMILFDPNDNIVRELHVSEPATMLAYEAVHAAHVPDRLWAIDQLSKLSSGDDRATAGEAFRTVAAFDRFYGVRAAAVSAGASFDDSAIVLTGTRDADVRVRLAAISAATQLHHPSDVIVTTLNALSSARDPQIAAAALSAMGRLRLPHAFDSLTRALDVQSFNEEIASGAIDGLGALGDQRAVLPIMKRTAYGISDNERNHAVAALAMLAMHLHREHEALRTLVHLATSDPVISTRLAAIGALGTLGDREALPSLHRLEQTDALEVVRLSSRNAIAALQMR